jgi:hypothetical protein
MVDLSGPRIEIIVDKTGETDTKVFGVIGAGCRALSKSWEELFGSVVSSSDTIEAYEDEHEVEIKSEVK